MKKQDNIFNGVALGGTAGVPFGWIGIVIGVFALASLYILLKK